MKTMTLMNNFRALGEGILTNMFVHTNLKRMGRKKKYNAPQGLVKMPGSPFWWIVWKGWEVEHSVHFS